MCSFEESVLNTVKILINVHTELFNEMLTIGSIHFDFQTLMRNSYPDGKIIFTEES